MSITVYGIRHHGPGSARSVRAALAGQRPDVVLIEGPPEADELVGLAAEEDMRPPVALLGYVPGEPRAGGVLAVRGVLAGVAGDQVRAERGGPGPVLRPAGRASAPAPGDRAGRAAAAHRSGERTGRRGRVRRPGTLVGRRGGARPRARGLRRAGRGHLDPAGRRRLERGSRSAGRGPRGVHAPGAAPDGQGRLRADRGGVRRLARAGPAADAISGRRRPVAARPAEGEGHPDLGAVDLRAAVLRLRLRGGHPLPRLV